MTALTSGALITTPGPLATPSGVPPAEIASGIRLRPSEPRTAQDDERAQPAAVDPDLLEPGLHRLPDPAAQLGGQRHQAQVAQRPGQVPGRVTVNPVPAARTGVSTRWSGCHGLTWKNWLSRAGRPGPRPKISTSSGSPLAGSAQTSTRPMVDAGSVGVTRSPAALPARHPHRRDHPVAGLPPGLGQQAQRQRRRDQVGRAGQPVGLRPADLGQQLVTGVPDVGAAAAELVGVPLAGVGEHVDPPPVRRRLPHPHLRRAVEQRGQPGQAGHRRQPERRVALRVARVGLVRGGQDAGAELARRSAGARSPAARWRSPAGRRAAPPRRPPAPTGARSGSSPRSSQVGYRGTRRTCHFAQTPNNGTITAGLRRAAYVTRKSKFAPLVRRPPPGLGSETVSNDRETLTRRLWRDGPVGQRWRTGKDSS